MVFRYILNVQSLPMTLHKQLNSGKGIRAAWAIVHGFIMP